MAATNLLDPSCSKLVDHSAADQSTADQPTTDQSTTNRQVHKVLPFVHTISLKILNHLHEALNHLRLAFDLALGLWFSGGQRRRGWMSCWLI